MTEAVHIPNATPFQLIKEDIDDFLTEARNWADGTPVETEEQSEAVSKLISDLNERAAAMEDARVEEKKPLDDKVKEIQDRYGEYIADRKNKKPGSVWKSIDALKALLAPYLKKKEDLIREEAAKKQGEADAAIEAARQAQQASNPGNLAETEAVEDKIGLALEVQKAATAANQVKAHATGGNRAMGLRSVWRAEITDQREAMIHFWSTNREAFVPFLQKLADDEVRSGKRSGIPGVTITEDRVL